MLLYLNRLFHIDNVHSIVGKKYYRGNDMFVLFIYVFLGKDTGCRKDGELTKGNILYSETLNEICEKQWGGGRNFKEGMELLRKFVKELNEKFICLLE